MIKPVFTQMIRLSISLVFLLIAQLVSVQATLAQSNYLEIVTDKGSRVFTVELALSDAERSVGLMNREQMDAGAGMLFRFDREQRAMMWMKNTLIPLDMLFIRADGVVADIHHDAVPHSEDIIRASQPVLYVLELNGGMAKKIGAKIGDRVFHPIIGKP